MLPVRRASGILRRYAVVDRVRWASTAAPLSKDKFKIIVLGDVRPVLIVISHNPFSALPLLP